MTSGFPGLLCLPAPGTYPRGDASAARFPRGATGRWHLGGSGHLPTDRGFGLNIPGVRGRHQDRHCLSRLAPRHVMAICP